MTFFSSLTTNFEFPPYFPCFNTFPPVSRKLLFPPYFGKLPPLFYTNSPAFYILYVYFVSPYFDHDAFMHHPMHVRAPRALCCRFDESYSDRYSQHPPYAPVPHHFSQIPQAHPFPASIS